MKLAGEQASRVPIQVIDERAFPNIPTSCSSSGTAEDTLDKLGANAILGVGLFRQDCGPACAFVGSSNPGFYYACPATGCQPAAVSLVNQVQNPVALFPTDNNGVVIQLPAVAAGGAFSVTGSLIYGIGTQSNNGLGSAKVLTVDAIGNITTIFGGQSYPSSFIDSGSNGIYFLDAASSGPAAVPGQLGLLLSGHAAIPLRHEPRRERRRPSPRCSMWGTPTRSIPASSRSAKSRGRTPVVSISGSGSSSAGACSRPSRARPRRVARGRTSRIDRSVRLQADVDGRLKAGR